MSKLKKSVDKLLAKTTIDEKVKAKLDALLDKTEIDDKIVDAWNKAEESGLIDKIKCYANCYGGYVVAVGAGCTFGVNNWVALGLLCVAAGWAYWATHCNNSAKCKR